MLFMALLPVKVMASDGAADDQDVWWSYDKPSEGVNESQTTTTSDRYIFADNWCAQEVVLYENLLVVAVEIRADDAGSPPNPLELHVCEDDGGDPGQSLGSASLSIEVYNWHNFTFSSPISITSTGKYHILCNTSGGDSSNKYKWYYNTSDLSYRSSTYQRELSTDAGSSWSDDTGDFAFKIYVQWALNTSGTTTTSYAYHWDEVYRYDFNHSFPAGMSNRQLNVTYPRSQYVINVTYPVGGVWNSTLSPGNYTDSALNATHNVVSLPDATIAAYGESYRLFTHTYSNYHTFHGPYYENGTVYPDPVNVIVYFQNDTSTSFSLDGGYVLANASVLAFDWKMPNGENRLMYPESAQTEHTLFIPESTYAYYTFTVYSYADGLPGWLETIRHVNGTARTIERRTVTATENEVPMVMVTGEIYFIQVRSQDGSTYDFGIFVPGQHPQTLKITPIAFSSRVQLTYKYLQVEGTRSANNTLITVNYSDSLNQTSWLGLEVRYRNDTVAYSSNITSPGASAQFQWNAADNETDYIAYLDIDHDYFGDMLHRMPLPLTATYSQPFNMTFLGSMPEGFPTSDLLSMGIIFTSAAVFSTVTAPLGGMMVVLTAAGLYQLGWVNWNTNLLMLAFALVVMMALNRARRGAG